MATDESEPTTGNGGAFAGKNDAHALPPRDTDGYGLREDEHHCHRALFHGRTNFMTIARALARTRGQGQGAGITNEELRVTASMRSGNSSRSLSCGHPCTMP